MKNHYKLFNLLSVTVFRWVPLIYEFAFYLSNETGDLPAAVDFLAWYIESFASELISTAATMLLSWPSAVSYSLVILDILSNSASW